MSVSCWQDTSQAINEMLREGLADRARMDKLVETLDGCPNVVAVLRSLANKSKKRIPNYVQAFSNEKRFVVRSLMILDYVVSWTLPLLELNGCFQVCHHTLCLMSCYFLNLVHYSDITHYSCAFKVLPLLEMNIALGKTN